MIAVARSFALTLEGRTIANDLDSRVWAVAALLAGMFAVAAVAVVVGRHRRRQSTAKSLGVKGMSSEGLGADWFALSSGAAEAAGTFSRQLDETMAAWGDAPVRQPDDQSPQRLGQARGTSFLPLAAGEAPAVRAGAPAYAQTRSVGSGAAVPPPPPPSRDAAAQPTREDLTFGATAVLPTAAAAPEFPDSAAAGRP